MGPKRFRNHLPTQNNLYIWGFMHNTFSIEWVSIPKIRKVIKQTESKHSWSLKYQSYIISGYYELYEFGQSNPVGQNHTSIQFY